MLVRPGRLFGGGNSALKFEAAPVQPSEPSQPILLPATTVIGAFGDSQTYGDYRMKSYLSMLPFHLRAGLAPRTTGRGTAAASGYNMGVAGQTGQQIADRASTIWGGPASRIYGLFGQNDGNGITAANQIGYWTTHLDRAKAAGKTVVAIPNAPTVTVMNNAALQARNAEVFAWLRGPAKDLYGATLEVLPDSIWSGIDFSSTVYAYDGVHPTNFGADRLAFNIAAVERPKFATATNAELIAALGLGPDLYAADFMSGGGTVPSGSTGVVAAGLAASLTGTAGLTIAFSLGILDGIPGQFIDVSGLAGTGTVQVQLRETAMVTFAIEEAFKAFGRIKQTARDGVSPPAGVQAIGFEPAGGRHQWMSRFSPLNEGGANFLIDGYFQNLPEENSAGGTSVSIDFAARFVPGATVDYRVFIGDVSSFKLAA